MKSTVQRLFTTGVLSLSLGLGLAGAAGAQGRPAGPHGPQAQTPQASGPQGPRGGRGDRSFPTEDMQKKREQRLHDLLQIKADQESAFRAFVSTLEQLRPQGPGREGRPFERLRQDGPQTTTQRLDRALQRATEVQQKLQKASSAVKIFYAVLSPEQRKAFDAMPILIGGEGRFGGRPMLMRGRFEGRGGWGRPGFGRPEGGPPPIR